MIKPIFLPWRHPDNWLENIRELLYYWPKAFIQRGSRGWADRDTWSLDHHICTIMIPMLKHLKETTHGFPCELTEESWNQKLDEIIEGFEAAKRIIDDEYYLKTGFPENRTEGDVEQWMKDSQADQELFKERMNIFVEYFFGLWD